MAAQASWRHRTPVPTKEDHMAITVDRSAHDTTLLHEHHLPAAFG